jgi:hypothetical protein
MAGLSAASVYAFWGRADGEPLLLVFSLLFGAFVGRWVACHTCEWAQRTDNRVRDRSYTALFPRFFAIVSGESNPCESTKPLLSISCACSLRQRTKPPTHFLHPPLFRSRSRQHCIRSAVYSTTRQSLQTRCDQGLRTSGLRRLDHVHRGYSRSERGGCSVQGFQEGVSGKRAGVTIRSSQAFSESLILIYRVVMKTNGIDMIIFESRSQRVSTNNSNHSHWQRPPINS